jgi:hypothetical protein
VDSTTPTAPKPERRDKRDNLTVSERALLRDYKQYAVSQIGPIRYQAAAISVPADFEIRAPYGGVVFFVDSNTGGQHTVIDGKCDCPYYGQHSYCKHLAAVNAVRAFIQAKGEGPTPAQERSARDLLTAKERHAKAKAEVARLFPNTPDAAPMVPAPATIATQQRPVDTLPSWATSLL